MTPHPQRCETCKKYDDCPVMSLIKAKRIKSDIPLISAAIIITPEIGCASHSDFQSEREKVLDELIDHCESVATIGDNMYHLVGWVPIQAIRYKAKELQQKAGEP
jgi:hypothetical protein